MRFRGAVSIAILVMAACAAPPGPPTSIATIGTSPSPAPTIASSLAPVPSPSGGSSALIIRTLGQEQSETFPLMTSEILSGGERGNCVKTKQGERTISQERLKSYLAAATGVERLIGESVWLGTLGGAARSLGSTEIVVPGNRTSRLALIVLRVPTGSDIDAPAGSLAAIGIGRLDTPPGANVPHGADLWLFTGDLIASVACH